MAEQNNTPGLPEPIDTKAILTVTPNRMEASILLSEPSGGGALPTIELLRECLAEKSVIGGVDETALLALVMDPVYRCPVVVARGTPPENGTNASLQYFVQLAKTLRPKERPDGTVDFRDMGLIETVEKDQLLCEKTAATPGEAGSDVYGKPVPPKPGKDCTLPAGKNTVLSDDKLKLTAAITGQVSVIDKRIHVLDTFTVSGDISLATGDIRFPGNVIVQGNVPAGFLVQAAGDVDIAGIVESANVTAGGSLIIRGGFSGRTSGELKVGGNLTCRFIQGGTVTLGGNLETTYIMNATINCGGEVNVTGKGLIIGGRVTAGTGVTAVTLGNENDTNTIIEVGINPEIFRRAQAIPKELSVCEKNLANIDLNIKTLMQFKAAGKLTPEKAEALPKALQYMLQLRQTQSDLTEQLEAIKEKLSSVDQGYVKVQKTAYPGVRIIMGSDQFPLQSEYSFTHFYRTQEGITSGPLR